MSNPLYADDPSYYERPGQDVPLIVDVAPSQYVGIALPWQQAGRYDHCTPRYNAEVSRIVAKGIPKPQDHRARMTLREPWE
jgi:hypothetical protein